MATKRQPERQPNGKQPYQPPRGIRFYEVDRAEPGSLRYFLQWRESGKRKTVGYASVGDREAAARALADKREHHGAVVMSFDPDKWRRFLEAEKLSGGFDLVEVVREWLVLRQGTDKVVGLTVAQAITKYLALRAEEGIDTSTTRHIEKHVRDRFGALHGSQPLVDITPEIIRTWIAGLLNPKTGEPMASVTRRHHRKDLNTFLNRAVAEGWLIRNPCESVPLPKIREDDVTVMPIEHVEKLFGAKNKGQRVLPRIALEAFGALRYVSAGRIRKEHVDFAAHGLTMPGLLHKSGKRKYRQGHPDNLWAWLDIATEETWGMSLVQYRHEKRDAFVRAGIPMPKNVVRHSFGSYHVALHRNQPLTAYLMQHNNPKTTDIYLGVATEADAKRYFAIVP